MKKTVLFFLVVLIGMLFLCAALANYGDDDAPETLPLADWMSYMPGKLSLGQLNLVGTHDAGCTFLKTGTQTLGQCHDNTLTQQMEHGIRAFDVRLKTFSLKYCDMNGNPYYNGTSWHDYPVGPEQLKLAHGPCDCYLDDRTAWGRELSLHFVFAYSCEFIRKHQRETIILMCTDEQGDGKGDDYRKAYDKTIAMIRDPENNPYPSQDDFNHDPTDSHYVPYVDMSMFVYYKEGDPIPRLEDVRGKIILTDSDNLSRNKEEDKKKTRYIKAAVTKYQDQCSMNVKDKKKTVREYLDKSEQVVDYDGVWSNQGEFATSPSSNPIYPHEPDIKLQFTSSNTGIGGSGPRAIAKKIIPELENNYTWEKNRRYGWIMVDFESDALTQKIIKTNEYAMDVTIRFDLPEGVSTETALKSLDVKLYRSSSKDHPGSSPVQTKVIGQDTDLWIYKSILLQDYEVYAYVKKSASLLFSDVKVTRLSAGEFVVTPILRERKSISVRMNWKDHHNRDHTRPASLTFFVRQFQGPSGKEAQEVDVKLPEGNEDTYELKVPSVLAVLPEGYTLEMEVFFPEEEEEPRYECALKKNSDLSWELTLTLKDIEAFEGTVTWIDRDSATRPDMAVWAKKVKLKGTTEFDETVTRAAGIAAADLDRDVIPVTGDVEKYLDIFPLTWSLVCPETDRYVLTMADDRNAVYTEAAKLSPTIGWKDCPENMKPDSLQVRLLRTRPDGTSEALETVTVTAAEGWIPAFEGTWPLLDEDHNIARYTLASADPLVSFTEQSETLVQADGTVRLTLTLTFSPATGLEGRLIWMDAGRGKTVPHPEATVILSGANDRQTTVTDDRYAFDALADGPTTLSLKLDPNDPESKKYKVYAKGTDFVLVYQQTVRLSVSWKDPAGIPMDPLRTVLVSLLREDSAGETALVGKQNVISEYTWTVPVSDEFGEAFSYSTDLRAGSSVLKHSDCHTDEYGDLHIDYTLTCEAGQTAVTLPFRVEVPTGPDHPDETFVITLAVEKDGAAVSEPLEKSVRLPMGSTESGELYFGVPFDAIGSWTLTVREVWGSSSGWTYAVTPVTVPVRTVWTARGGLKAEWTDPGITFRNRYKYAGEPVKTDITVINSTLNLSDESMCPKETFRYMLLVDGEQRDECYITDEGTYRFQTGFDRPGTYTVEVAQIEGNSAGWLYDGQPITVIVTVALQADGTLKAVYEPKPEAHFYNVFYGISKKLTGEKQWFDEEDESLRPAGITVRLLAETESRSPWEVASRLVTPGADGRWTYDFGEQPLLDGEEWITYSVAEDPVPGYIAGSQELFLYNALSPVERKTDIPVRVFWDKEERTAQGAQAAGTAALPENARPESVEITLYADGKTVAKRSVSEADGWKTVFEKMRCFTEDGRLIDYTVTGENVRGYTVSVDEPERGRFEVRYRPAMTEYRVSARWVFGNEKRKPVLPRSVTVTLYADGREAGTARLTETNGWEAVFAGLPAFDRKTGREIRYTVKGEEIRDFTLRQEDAGTNRAILIYTAVVVPPTGDRSSPLLLWLGMLFSGSALLSGLFLRKRERRNGSKPGSSTGA